MNAKVLSSLATALVVTSFVPPAIAESLGEHPAVVVARTWNNRGIDPNTFIVAHPASTRWVACRSSKDELLATVDVVSRSAARIQFSFQLPPPTEGHGMAIIEEYVEGLMIAAVRYPN